MKAVLRRTYGSPDVLTLEETGLPVPAEGEVLIRVRAASVNPLDWHLMRGTPYVGRVGMGFRGPKDARLGVDLSGVVEAAGKSVTRFRPGDEVFGTGRGAFAEYASAPEKKLAPKPAGLTFEQAAAIPVAGCTALQGLRDRGRIRPGQKVLINGAAGGVGTFAVQIARSYGADVTGVCRTGNVEMVRALGAGRVVDYTREDFAERGDRYDLFLDCIASRPLAACRRVLGPAGTYVAVTGRNGNWLGPLAHMLKTLLVSPFVSQRMVPCFASIDPGDLTALTELIEAGKVRPVVDRTCPLAEVPAAIRYLEEGHARGKVVITISA